MGAGAAGALFVGFGLASLVVAVPFLWRALPWKRLLAYSSLEHMGVIALGIGFGTRSHRRCLHVAGHALAKALGFYAATAAAARRPRRRRRAPPGVAAQPPDAPPAMGLSLGALAGLAVPAVRLPS